MTIDPQNLSGYAQLTFSDEFETLNLRTGSTGVWSTNFWFGQPNGTTLSNNGEQEWYIDANYGPTQSVKPWTVDNGVLEITAKNASPEIQQQIDGYKYTSGVLTSFESFSQKYGYFEMRAELPQGNGLWPAFWLLPADGSWPPEIDVMEQLGNNPNMYYTTEHSNATGVPTSQGSSIVTADLTTSFNNYGVDWEEDKLTYYLNGKQVFQTDTPADMDKPMYMLVNLAVGGYWPGDPTPDPNYSETMKVDYIRAYSENSKSEATSDTQSALEDIVSQTGSTPETRIETTLGAQATSAQDSASTSYTTQPTTEVASDNVPAPSDRAAESQFTQTTLSQSGSSEAEAVPDPQTSDPVQAPTLPASQTSSELTSTQSNDPSPQDRFDFSGLPSSQPDPNVHMTSWDSQTPVIDQTAQPLQQAQIEGLRDSSSDTYIEPNPPLVDNSIQLHKDWVF